MRLFRDQAVTQVLLTLLFSSIKIHWIQYLSIPVFLSVCVCALVYVCVYVCVRLSVCLCIHASQQDQLISWISYDKPCVIHTLSNTYTHIQSRYINPSFRRVHHFCLCENDAAPLWLHVAIATREKLFLYIFNARPVNHSAVHSVHTDIVCFLLSWSPAYYVTSCQNTGSRVQCFSAHQQALRFTFLLWEKTGLNHNSHWEERDTAFITTGGNTVIYRDFNSLLTESE